MAPAALVASIAALAVGTAALVQGRGGDERAAATATSAVAPATAGGDTEAADKALCQGIAPLMAEDDQRSNAFVALGPSGSAARDAGVDRFRADTAAWATRIQAVADQHQSADPFLRRTLQRFIDDRRLIARNMRTGKTMEYDDAIWSDSLAAYGGPLGMCYDLGVRW